MMSQKMSVAVNAEDEAAQDSQSQPPQSGERTRSVSGEYPVANDTSIPKSRETGKPSVRIAVDNVHKNDMEKFGSRDTLVAVESGRKDISYKTAKLLQTSRDPRLESDDLQVAFSALDKYTADIETDRQLKIIDERRKAAHIALTNKSRGRSTSATTEALSKELLKPSIYEKAKNAVSRVVSGIGGFFKKLVQPQSGLRRAAIVGTLVGGSILGASNCTDCGKGCNGRHPDGTGPVASSSSDGGGGSAPQNVEEADTTTIPTAKPVTTNDVPPVDVNKLKDTDKSKDKADPVKPPKLAKVSHIPKPNDILNPPKVKEPPKKVEPPKVAGLKDCTNDTQLAPNNLDRCLVPSQDAEKLRTGLLAQLDEQQKALDKVFAPIPRGPEYINGSQPYKRERSPIVFLEGQGVPVGSQSPNLIWRQNSDHLKVAAANIATARTQVNNAKTPKDFYAATEIIGSIGEQIDVLIAERGKQVAASVDAANAINTVYIKDKMTDLEKETDKSIHTVPLTESDNGGTISKSTIDVPMTKKLLEGNEQDMLSAPRGQDPDKVILSVQKKLEYYRGLLKLSDDLDSLRVRQRPSLSVAGKVDLNGVRVMATVGTRF